MTETLRRIAGSGPFNTAVLVAILTASVIVGLLSYPEIEERYGTLLHAIDTAIIWLFVAEAAIKIGAEGRRPWRYFQSGWNSFDFLIVAVAALPLHSSFAAVFRLVRILRILRLVKALPRLRMIVNALIKSFSAMGYVSLLLVLHFYIFAAVGVSLFGRNDPLHFGRLDRALLTLFQCLTLDDWTAIMNIQLLGGDVAPYYEGREHLVLEPATFPIVGPLYFVSFVLLGTMIILNLFIGVITQGMTESQQELADERHRQAEAREAKMAAMGAPGVVPGLVQPALAAGTPGVRTAAPRRRKVRRPTRLRGAVRSMGRGQDSGS